MCTDASPKGDVHHYFTVQTIAQTQESMNNHDVLYDLRLVTTHTEGNGHLLSGRCVLPLYRGGVLGSLQFLESDRIMFYVLERATKKENSQL